MEKIYDVVGMGSPLVDFTAKVDESILDEIDFSV